ncbi:MAG: alpha/beta fold hydrolase [Chloroflexi bacterium]|nr:alpha/beta fold hydrolase [Chloroflexota bacterium]
MTNIMPGAEPFHMKGGPTGCLLVHGFTGTPHEMLWLGTQLAADGHSVRGPRLAGHATTPEEMSTTRWPDWYAGVRDAYRQLHAECARVFVIGLSMGGMLAAHLAATEQPDGIVLMASPAHIRDWRITLFRPFQRFIPYWPTGGVSYTDAELGDGHLVYDRYPTGCVVSLLDLAGEMRKDLPRATAPSLLVFSKVDRLADEPEARWVFDRLGAADKRLVLLERSGHIICADCERETVLAEVRRFISAHGG